MLLNSARALHTPLVKGVHEHGRLCAGQERGQESGSLSSRLSLQMPALPLSTQPLQVQAETGGNPDAGVEHVSLPVNEETQDPFRWDLEGEPVGKEG